MNAQTKLSAKGQVVIPKDVRDRLHWQQGQALEVVETSEGVLLKQPSLRPRTITIQEMNETIDEGWRQAALKSDCAKR
jgi:AbrB family looped-hinge helix DNA binding protein